MKKLSLIILIIITVGILFSDTNFRVMSYNTLNFDGTTRLSDFELILSEVQPDILINQEINSEAAADEMLNILNSAIGGYSRASFINDGELNNMLYYKSSIASLTAQSQISATPRDISEYEMFIDGNPVRFYSCHLKSSDTLDDEAERLSAVTNLREHLNTLPSGTEFVICGDMNFYSDSESGYQKFIADEANNNGRSQDVCSEVGSWHNNYSFRNVHTQSPRYTQFGGGAGGGLDDKFDFIFASYNFNDGAGIEFTQSSFTSFGNDGDHFNQSVNDSTNSVVSSSIADALYNASDHLPVFADFTSLSGTQTYLIISEYVEGFGNNKAIEIYNGTGSAVDLSVYSLQKDVNGNNVWNNTYNYSGMLANDDVFVLANSNASQLILDVADTTNNGVINFNGDDQVRLYKNEVVIDHLGESGDVDWGKDVTLVRMSGIDSPNTNYNETEWNSFDQDTFEYLGFHVFDNDSVDDMLIDRYKYEVTISNYPNPFRTATTISFSTSEHMENTELIIYNIEGEKVKKYTIFKNQSSITWNGKDKNNKQVSSGIYLYKLSIGKYKKTKKMILMK